MGGREQREGLLKVTQNQGRDCNSGPACLEYRRMGGGGEGGFYQHFDPQVDN